VFIKNIVIGHSLASIMYAFYNQYHFIANCTFRPFFFDDPEKQSFLGMKGKREIFDEIQNILSFVGANLTEKETKRIRVSDNSLKLFGNDLLASYTFEKCYICDNANITFENPVKIAKPKTFLVIDDFKLSRLGTKKENLSPINTLDKLVFKACFYNSGRVDGAKRVTDAITLSRLEEKDLHDFNYSDTMAMFKLRSCLADAGYAGVYEKAPQPNSKPKLRRVTVEHVERILFEEDNNEYFDSDRIKFINPSVEEFYSGYTTCK
tara:strand:- start:2989 stop:3780 length:792 start_codon:yes stop_codon:yes gene_type:complete